MTTYRDEASGVGDTTTWAYDEASGLLLSKTYADGKGLTYTYADDGRLATRTNARGIVTTYTYDDWGQLLAIDYVDATPDIAYAYDAMGRQTSATDAVGVTTFTYDATGQLTSEQVSGLYSKTLTRHYDAFGRNVGYSVDGERKQSITYDPATGRIATMDNFTWAYLSGSNLKSRLTYPNGATAEWDYEPTRDLLARVTNTINGAVASQYDYVNDLLGRRIGIDKSGSMMAADETQPYGYNVRDELISGQNQTYAYDDIGNRTAAEGKTYTANNLNQYTAIDDFMPEYDADGNQTLIKTETGVWSVVYNAENRPVRWESGDAVITMTFDRLGRRVDYCETRAGQAVTHFRFVYDNFLCVQRLDAANDNAVRTEFVWDPTEPIATRPLVFQPASGETAYYFHDGNKNVSEVFYHATRVTNRDLLSENPFRFSSEYYDFTFGLAYYNYRHYQTHIGRWCAREPLEEMERFGIYGFVRNSPIDLHDICGLIVRITYVTPSGESATVELPQRGTIDEFKKLLEQIKQEKGKICELYCGGHGSIDHITINGVWERGGLLAKTNVPGSLRLTSTGSNIFLHEGLEGNGEPKWKRSAITAELKELLGENALIDFNACLTACTWFSDENLAQQTSKVFPNARVKGSRGFSAGLPVWGQEPFIRIPRTYINGEEQ